MLVYLEDITNVTTMLTFISWHMYCVLGNDREISTIYTIAIV
jgi:hypothetical protein